MTNRPATEVHEAAQASGSADLTVPTIPVLDAYLSDTGQLWAWCAHESAWHRHGRGDGHRRPHCLCRCSPYVSTGYQLREVGPLTRELLQSRHSADEPYWPYPPFVDPRDWREVVGGASESIQNKARQLVDEATQDHEQRHVHHAHPWCYECTRRELLSPAGCLSTVTAAELGQRLMRGAKVGPDAPEVGEMRTLVDSGFVFDLEGALEVWPDADPQRLEAILDFVRDLADLEWTQDEASRRSLSRCCRWLVINSRQPEDPWPNIDPPDQLDDEYLDRDELAELQVADTLIAGTLPRRSYVVLRGRDQSLKSFVAIDWALSLATGTAWQGRAAEPVRVLYVAGEGAHGLVARVEAWEAAHGVTVPDEMFTVRRSALDMFKPGPAFDHLLERVREGDYGLVVIDTLRRVAGGAEGNGSDMGTVIDNVDRIKRATDEGSVLVVAHTDKGDNDARGFSGIEDDADAVWHAKRDDQNLTLELKKMKDGADGRKVELTAVREGSSLVLVPAVAQTTVVSESQQRLLETARQHPDGLATSQLMAASGLPQTTFYRVLGDLRTRGLLVNEGTKSRPRYVYVPSQEVPRA